MDNVGISTRYWNGGEPDGINAKTKTMTVAIYTEVLRGNYGVAAALSTILTVLTVTSLLLFMKISKNNSITL